MPKLKQLLALLALATLVGLPLATAAQELPTNAQEGLQRTGERAYGPATDLHPVQAVGRIINAVLGFMGVLFLILIIYAGILWMVSGGDETKVAKARKIIVNATIGLAIVLLAYAITWFVTNQILDVTAEAPAPPPEP